MTSKMLSTKWYTVWLSLNVLTYCCIHFIMECHLLQGEHLIIWKKIAYWSHRILPSSCPIPLKFDSYLGSFAAEEPVSFQCVTLVYTVILIASRLRTKLIRHFTFSSYLINESTMIFQSFTLDYYPLRLHNFTHGFILSMSLAHWGQGKMSTISLRTFSNAFSWMKKLEFLYKFNWNVLPWFQLIITQHWFR